MDKPIFTFRKNATEEVRVGLDSFKGRDLVSIRIWANYNSADSEKRPTRKGVSMKVEKLPQLIVALQQAESHARDKGLLP